MQISDPAPWQRILRAGRGSCARPREKPCLSASAIRHCCARTRSPAIFPPSKFLGKAEWYNPGGSVKDRAAASIVTEACRTGKLAPGKILLDSTSGNTGIAYAMLGAALGFPVTLCVPENVSRSESAFYRLTAQISSTPIRPKVPMAPSRSRGNWRESFRSLFLRGSVLERSQLARALPDHRERSLGANKGRITHFVSMLGTTGTFVGTTRRLKELNPYIRCISLQPDSAFHGLKAQSICPLRSCRASTMRAGRRESEISTEEAHAMARRLAREHGLLRRSLLGCRGGGQACRSPRD